MYLNKRYTGKRISEFKVKGLAAELPESVHFVLERKIQGSEVPSLI